MADTNETDLPPQTNGIADNGSDEDDRSKMRPADIDAVSCEWKLCEVLSNCKSNLQ